MRTLMLALAALLSLSVAAPVDAAAQQRRPASQQSANQSATRATNAARVSMSMMVVQASQDGTYMDPKLQSLERHLKFLSYTNFTVINQKRSELTQNAEKTFSLDGGKEVSVTLMSTENNKARLRVKVSSSRGNLVDTTISVNNGSTFVVAGPRHDGGVLILPITASF